MLLIRQVCLFIHCHRKTLLLSLVMSVLLTHLCCDREVCHSMWMVLAAGLTPPPQAVGAPV